MKKGIMFMAVFLLASSAFTVKADEVAELKVQMKQMQERLEQMEAAQKAQEQSVDAKISKAVEAKEVNVPDSLKWAEKVKISGDLRYRHESIDSSNAAGWESRHRIRARLGLDAKINDEWDARFQIASGSADPVSTNQTLDESFSSKTIWLDLAYFTWHPEAMNGLNVYGGKMVNPFYTVGGNQLIWDGDLNPEGVAASYLIPLGENDELTITGGGLWVNENSSATSTVDTSLWGLQGSLKHKFEDKSYLLGGVSYFDYGNIQGTGNLKQTWSTSSSFFGNTSSGGAFVNDYDILELFSEYGFKVGEMPVAVFGDYVTNTVATTSEDTGWLIGCKFNKAKDPGSWELSYDYRDLEADAVVGALSDSDFIGGGTDGKGHRFGFKYQIAKNLQGGLAYFLNEFGSNNTDYNRLQADLMLKF